MYKGTLGGSTVCVKRLRAATKDELQAANKVGLFCAIASVFVIEGTP